MSATAKKVLIIGPGHLGTRVIENLALAPGSHEYWIAGRDANYISRYINLFRQLSAANGNRLRAQELALDIENVEQTAETIGRVKPDVVLMTASMQRWWVGAALPTSTANLLGKVQAGPWLPLDLVLIYELMQAVALSGQRPLVVNSCYPDVTHPVLATRGLAPSIGFGNIAMTVLALQLLISQEKDVHPQDVSLRAVFHHFVHYAATRRGEVGDAPFHITATVLGTPEPPRVADWFRMLASTSRRLSGAHFQHITAATGLSVLRPILDDTSAITHAPGPMGLPGGYPIAINDGEISLLLPEGMTIDQAVAINEGGARCDGIEAVNSDGSVRFSAEQTKLMSDALGYRCEVMPLEECRSFAEELQCKFQEAAGLGPEDRQYVSRTLPTGRP